jgi:hypothetical protein
MALPVAGYDSLLEDILRRTEEQRKIADARGIGEAQRRGMVNPTGTSDIEMSLRRAQTEPVVQGGQSEIAKILANIAEQQEARKYQTGERVAGQEYGTSERLGSQGWQTGENVAQRGWQTGENTAQRGWQSGENQLQRGWQTGEREGAQTWQGKMAGFIDPTTGEWTPTYESGGNKQYGARGQSSQDYINQMAMVKAQQPKKKPWYQTGASELAGAGGSALGAWASPGGWWG